MARAALDHLAFGARRRRGQALLRIFNPTEEEHGYTSTYTVVEMVNDDMPFLVDSVSAAINRHNLAVDITVHPIIWVKRDAKGKLTRIATPGTKDARAESFIRLAIERETDAAQLKLLRQEIVKVLADVRVAVRDWQPMRKRMLENARAARERPQGRRSAAANGKPGPARLDGRRPFHVPRLSRVRAREARPGACF